MLIDLAQQNCKGSFALAPNVGRWLSPAEQVRYGICRVKRKYV